MKHQLDLPLELAAHREKFEAGIRPFVRVLPQAVDVCLPWQSKFGGLPYLPKGSEWPLGSGGRPLYLLAQINFGESPALPPFPERGLLQFFIADDRNYGADAADPANAAGFRVVFFPKIEKRTARLQAGLAQASPDNLPFDPALSFPLKFEIGHEGVPLTDHRVHGFIEDDFFARFGDRKWEMMEAYSKGVHAGGHKLGGYAFFAQQDPRPRYPEPMELLLQIDSDQGLCCQWGDMGTAHFFIKTEDLERRDFSRVAYQWDCF